METFYFILAFVFVLSFYAYSIRLRKDKVLVAFTQPIDDPAFVGAQKRSYYKKHKVYKDPEGKIINPKAMMIMFVSGNGMSPKVNHGDEIIVIKTDKNKIKEQIKQINRDDILLLFLGDKGMYYLRALEYYSDENDILETRYINGNGCSFKDKTENVCGIARYKIGEASTL